MRRIRRRSPRLACSHRGGQVLQEHSGISGGIDARYHQRCQPVLQEPLFPLILLGGPEAVQIYLAQPLQPLLRLLPGLGNLLDLIGKVYLCQDLLGVSGFGQFWVREIGVKKLLV